MNIQQLEYIIAVDEHRHFSKAAEASFVTQPTLSMMIQKLEDELGVKIFDRSQLPVQPTEIGRKIIKQARISIAKINQINDIIEEEKGMLKGVFKLGIIPTISPYLVPRLMNIHKQFNPDIRIMISELTITKSFMLMYRLWKNLYMLKHRSTKVILQPLNCGCLTKCIVSEHKFCICAI